MGDLDLPRGPLVQTLTAAHDVARHLAAAASLAEGLPGSHRDTLAVHAEHMRRVAAYTAEPHCPPRPDPLKPDEGGRSGWEMLLADREGTVVAGWTDRGVFVIYEPPETIIRDLLDALMEAHNHDRS